MVGHKRTILLVSILALAPLADVANADYTFGTPTNIGPSPYTAPSISTDGLSLYVDARQSSGYGGYDIWISTRETIHEDWPEPVNLGPPINSPSGEGNPDISADGLTLFVASDRPGGHGDSDIWLTRRTTTDEPWSDPVNLGPPINGPYYDSHPSVSTDGLSLFFSSTRPGGHGDRDTWLSTRATTNDPWSEPVNLGPIVNSPSFDSGPDISSDGLMLFFDSRRPGGHGGRDIWVARRATTDDPWSEPVNLGPIVNTPSNDFTACISADGSILYFWSNGYLRQVPIDPVVDLNGDGSVDVKDVVVMTEHWGENYPLCDIGPTPMGDGIVDVRDLVVLTEHMEPESQVLVAHWPLDETEGMTAHERISGNSDVVVGGAHWQPTGGVVDGALELDGVDGALITLFGPNPADGPFSVEAWIMGGAAGQVIVSQPLGANWLMADASDGKLMSELKDSGGSTVPLISETVITNGEWHRVGLAWDGSQRTLSVGGVVVAEDTQNSLAASTSGLYIGVGKDYAQGTFFSGLLDDVRIYNRVVWP